MTDINPLAKAPDVTQEELNEWFTLQTTIADLSAREKELRGKIFAAKFPNPKEGTNKFALSEGWVLNGQHIINRKVDLASLKNHEEDLAAAKVPTDLIFKYVPELVKSAYNHLTDEQKKVVDACLIIKPGMPQLEIKLPKR
jgi:serine protease inhibitor